MGTTRQELLWGRPDAPRSGTIVGFAGVVTLVLGAVVATNTLGTTHPVRRFGYDVGLPFVLFYAPGLVAAVAAYFRCGVAACLIAGVVPGACFAAIAVIGAALGVPGVGGGDAPLGSITLAFAAIGLVAASAGYFVGASVRLAVSTIRRRRVG